VEEIEVEEGGGRYLYPFTTPRSAYEIFRSPLVTGCYQHDYSSAKEGSPIMKSKSTYLGGDILTDSPIPFMCQSRERMWLNTL
jgi:hypothetical protein